MNKRRRFKAKRKRAAFKADRERYAAARRMGMGFQRIEVSERDYAAILAAIRNPPAPNAALRALLARPGIGFVQTMPLGPKFIID